MKTVLARPVDESDFRGVPEEVCTIPLFMDEEGIVYAYGHQDEDAMVNAVYKLHEYYEILEEGFVASSQDVFHRYAKILIPEGYDKPVFDFTDEDTSFMICHRDDEGAFPLTVWKY